LLCLLFHGTFSDHSGLLPLGFNLHFEWQESPDGIHSVERLTMKEETKKQANQNKSEAKKGNKKKIRNKKYIKDKRRMQEINKA
jgi:hypothetical protein